MSRLIALPVDGDAFILQRAGYTILVDGGKRSALLASELAKFKVTHLDYVVCTHADEDHAGGLVDLLGRSSISVNEFWLPGAWLQSLPVLLPHPKKVVDKLVDEADLFQEQDVFNEKKAYAGESEINARQIEYNNFRKEKDLDIKQREQEKSGRGLDWLKGWVRPSTVSSVDAARMFRNGERRIKYRVRKKGMSSQTAGNWIRLIKTAQRIREIALQAIGHNVCVRWFDHKDFRRKNYAEGGEPELLIPLNSIELTAPPTLVMGLMHKKLSTFNVHSLVFLSPGYDEAEAPEHSRFSVVFTGDSPLGYGKNYAQSWLIWPNKASTRTIATAPHHGSESNAHAYAHLQAVTDVLIWIRSGGLSRHPEGTYRSIPIGSRYCTNCPHFGLERRVVELNMVAPFLIDVKGYQCSC